MAEEAERFAPARAEADGVPVEMVDERLTMGSERLMEEVQGRFIHDEKLSGSKNRRMFRARMTVDAVAAAVILKETWIGRASVEKLREKNVIGEAEFEVFARVFLLCADCRGRRRMDLVWHHQAIPGLCGGRRLRRLAAWGLGRTAYLLKNKRCGAQRSGA